MLKSELVKTKLQQLIQNGNIGQWGQKWPCKMGRQCFIRLMVWPPSDGLINVMYMHCPHFMEMKWCQYLLDVTKISL